MNKRILALVFAIIMIISLVGCQADQPESSTQVTEVTEPVPTEEPAPQKPAVDTLGWKLNPTEMDTELLADAAGAFTETYENMIFKPVACLSVNENENTTYRFLCRSEEAEVAETEAEEESVDETEASETEDENSEVKDEIDELAEINKESQFTPNLYMVTVEVNADGSRITEVEDFDITALMEMTGDEAKVNLDKFTADGWKQYSEQAVAEIPTAVDKALDAVSTNGEVVQFVAVHGAEDGTLTFAILFRNKTEETTDLNMTFIAVPVDGNSEILNTVSVI